MVQIGIIFLQPFSRLSAIRRAGKTLTASTVFRNRNACAIRVPAEIPITAAALKRNPSALRDYAEGTRIATPVPTPSNVSAHPASLAIHISNVSVSIANHYSNLSYFSHLEFALN